VGYGVGRSRQWERTVPELGDAALQKGAVCSTAP